MALPQFYPYDQPPQSEYDAMGGRGRSPLAAGFRALARHGEKNAAAVAASEPVRGALEVTLPLPAVTKNAIAGANNAGANTITPGGNYEGSYQKQKAERGVGSMGAPPTPPGSIGGVADSGAKFTMAPSGVAGISRIDEQRQSPLFTNKGLAGRDEIQGMKAPLPSVAGVLAGVPDMPSVIYGQRDQMGNLVDGPATYGGVARGGQSFVGGGRPYRGNEVGGPFVGADVGGNMVNPGRSYVTEPARMGPNGPEAAYTRPSIDVQIGRGNGGGSNRSDGPMFSSDGGPQGGGTGLFSPQADSRLSAMDEQIDKYTRPGASIFDQWRGRQLSKRRDAYDMHQTLRAGTGINAFNAETGRMKLGVEANSAMQTALAHRYGSDQTRAAHDNATQAELLKGAGDRWLIDQRNKLIREGKHAEADKLTRYIHPTVPQESRVTAPNIPGGPYAIAMPGGEVRFTSPEMEAAAAEKAKRDAQREAVAGAR
jgi:hypothetical protein